MVKSAENERRLISQGMHVRCQRPVAEGCVVAAVPLCRSIHLGCETPLDLPTITYARHTPQPGEVVRRQVRGGGASFGGVL